MPFCSINNASSVCTLKTNKNKTVHFKYQNDALKYPPPPYKKTKQKKQRVGCWTLYALNCSNYNYIIAEGDGLSESVYE